MDLGAQLEKTGFLQHVAFDMLFGVDNHIYFFLQIKWWYLFISTDLQDFYSFKFEYQNLYD